jgi:hypothetical protein
MYKIKDYDSAFLTRMLFTQLIILYLHRGLSTDIDYEAFPSKKYIYKYITIRINKRGNTNVKLTRNYTQDITDTHTNKQYYQTSIS